MHEVTYVLHKVCVLQGGINIHLTHAQRKIVFLLLANTDVHTYTCTSESSLHCYHFLGILVSINVRIAALVI